ncbi:hypothetical protein IT418_00435 [bacterium]|nr:hypothetical protein [bacterium]
MTPETDLIEKKNRIEAQEAEKDRQDPSRVTRREKFLEYVRKILDSETFVRPMLFHQLLDTEAFLPTDTKNKRLVVWTFPEYDKPKIHLRRYMTAKKFRALRLLLGGSSQTLAPLKPRIFLKEDVLFVMDIPVKIDKSNAQLLICTAIMNAPKQTLAIDELWEKIGERPTDETRRVYKISHAKVARLNQHINSKIVGPSVFLAKYGYVSINPMFLSYPEVETTQDTEASTI